MHAFKGHNSNLKGMSGIFTDLYEYYKGRRLTKVLINDTCINPNEFYCVHKVVFFYTNGSSTSIYTETMNSFDIVGYYTKWLTNNNWEHFKCHRSNFKSRNSPE